MVRQEQRIEEARREYRDTAAALKEPFKHEEALRKAQWEVEWNGRQTSGEEGHRTSMPPSKRTTDYND